MFLSCHFFYFTTISGICGKSCRWKPIIKINNDFCLRFGLGIYSYCHVIYSVWGIVMVQLEEKLFYWLKKIGSYIVRQSGCFWIWFIFPPNRRYSVKYRIRLLFFFTENKSVFFFFINFPHLILKEWICNSGIILTNGKFLKYSQVILILKN